MIDSTAFCVVCGRFDRDLVLRKSGLKCSFCIGVRSNKEYANLQAQHAQFLLARTAGAVPPPVGQMPFPSILMPRSPIARAPGESRFPQPAQEEGSRAASAPAADQLNATTRSDLNGSLSASRSAASLRPPVSPRAPPLSPRDASSPSVSREVQSPFLTSTTGGASATPASPQATSPAERNGGSGGSNGGVLSSIASTLRASFGNQTQLADDETPYGGTQLQLLCRGKPFDLDDLSVLVDEPLKEKGAGGPETMTYRFFVFCETKGTPIVSVRHRFRDALRVLSKLKELGGAQLPELPEKKLLQRFNPQFIEERRSALQLFCNAGVHSAFFVRHPKFMAFLGLEAAVRAVASEVARGGRSARSGEGEVRQEDLRFCKLGTLLGKGAFGSVYMGLLPATSQLVAVKIIAVTSIVDAEVEKLQSELQLLRLFVHPNVVRFHGALWRPVEKDLCIFTEYVECGTVTAMVKRFGALPLAVIQRYLRQILSGLAYLHSLNVVHRDIKGENILVTKSGSVKLADFGCSGHIAALAVDGMTGTPSFMAPELMRGDPASLAVDIWSLGCVGIEMLNRQPWKVDAKENVYTTMFRIQRSTNPPDGIPEEGEVPPGFRSFLLDCLNRDPARRPTALQLMTHPFFSVDFAEREEEGSGLGFDRGASFGGLSGDGGGPSGGDVDAFKDGPLAKAAGRPDLVAQQHFENNAALDRAEGFDLV